MRRTLPRWTSSTLLALAAVLVSAGVLLAHDFWLVPDAFRVTPGGWIEVRGQTSSRFPTSEAAVALDRIADARLISGGEEERITGLSHSGTSLRIRHRPQRSGQYVVALSLHPRSVRESAAGFVRYLELEGAPEAIERYRREGILPARDSVTRRYTKYAKTFVEVGTRGARAFSRAAGHPLEFVPLSDPAAARTGGTIAFRLLFRGQPLGGARMHAGTTTGADAHLETDASGVVQVRLTRSGVWNVRTLQIVPVSQGSGADWDAHWATAVFEVRGAGGAAPAPAAGSAAGAGDSAEVAAAVDRYHEALAAGDSLAALRLLSPDAIILESGGQETREEYRGHHLPGDIAFARAVRSERSPVRVRIRGDVAWATSTSITQGTYNGRAINSAGAELMVLVRTPEGWRISAIHWSSRARRTQ